MNDLTVLDGNGGLPAHLQQMFGGSSTNADLAGGIGMGFPILSYKGKTWAVNVGGERTILYNADGDARQSIEAVIIRANPGLSKIYYSHGYEEGSTAKPDCYSHDGKVPAADAQAQQAEKCAICPMNQWGSRITENGSKGKACSDSKRLAVASPNELDNPMLLRIPAATLKDLAKYAEDLGKRRAPVEAVVTKISFDPSVAHPKMVFKPVRWLTADEAAHVLETKDGDTVRQIVGIDPSPIEDMEGLEGEPPAAMVQQPRPAPAAPAAPRAVPRQPTKAAVQRQAATATDTEIEAALGGQPKPAAPAATQAAPKPAAPKPTAPAAPVKQSAAAAVLAEVDASLDDVLASLDD